MMPRPRVGARTDARAARRAARRRRTLAGPGAALPQCTTAAGPVHRPVNPVGAAGRGVVWVLAERQRPRGFPLASGARPRLARTTCSPGPTSRAILGIGQAPPPDVTLQCEKMQARVPPPAAAGSVRRGGQVGLHTLRVRMPLGARGDSWLPGREEGRAVLSPGHRLTPPPPHGG